MKFQHFRINLPVKYYTLFTKTELDLQKIRKESIEKVFSERRDFTFYSKNYYYIPFAKNRPDGFIIGFIEKEGAKDIREVPGEKLSKKKHHRRSLVLINPATNSENGQQVCILQTDGFKKDLSKLIRELWNQANIKISDLDLDLNINPLIVEEAGFWQCFDDGVHEMIIKYNRGNFGTNNFKDEMNSALDSMNASSIVQKYENSDGHLKPLKKEHLEAGLEEIKKGHGSIKLKKITKKKRITVFDSTKESLIKTSEIEEEINIDEIEGNEDQIQKENVHPSVSI